MTKAVVGSSMRPLGTDGGQGRRFLFHHLPLALASAGFLVVFMTAPRFDAHASAHGDITSGPFPRARAAGGPMGHAAPGDPERDGAPTGMRSHGADHAGRTSHGGHGHTSATRPAEPESTAHVTRDAGSRHSDGTSESRDERADSSLSRRVQQLTVATGYLGVIFLALTLLLGPANLLLRRRNPVSSYLRRDVGIWTAIFSLAH
ncbi:MAG TPA: hypothetical protein VGQ37_03240, partial [Vicinamibacterales bacterium]|nr:hypothetical protein [Vicinamibacterales bacterium]